MILRFSIRRARFNLRAWLRHFRRRHYRHVLWRLAAWEAIRAERRDRLTNGRQYRA